MRHAILGTSYGTHSRLYKALLFGLLQGLLCSGEVFHMRMGAGSARASSLQTRYFTQENQAPMASTRTDNKSNNNNNNHNNISKILPSLTSLGFMPRESQGRELPENTPGGPVDVPDDSLDSKIWEALVDRVLETGTTTTTATTHPVDGSSSTTQLPVPHLDALYFGASSRRTNHSGYHLGVTVGDRVAVIQPFVSPSDEVDARRRYLHGLLALGLGSFVGGAAVILLLFSVIYLRCWRRHRKPSGDPEDVEAKHSEGEKIGRQVTTSATKSSTSGCSSSSASGETTSNSSDNTSDSVDLWLAPQPAGVATIPLHARSPQPPSPYRAHTAAARSLEVTQHVSDIPRRPSSSSGSPEDANVTLSSCVDLLDVTKAGGGPGTEFVSEEGAIVSLPGTDIVAVLPPGAVQQGQVQVSLRSHDPATYHTLKRHTQEVALSTVIELSAPDTDLFAKSVAVKCPFRCLSAVGPPCPCREAAVAAQCGACDRARIELRYCDTSTSEYSPYQHEQWSVVPCQALGGHYGWSECLQDELGPDSPRIPRKHVSAGEAGPRARRTSVSYRCDDSTCCVDTKAPGLYCLVYVPQGDNYSPGTWSPCRLASPLVSSPSASCCVRMSVVVYATYNTGESGETTSAQVRYAVCLTDNTTSTKQAMCDFLQSSGYHRESDCVPIDVAVGANIYISLASVPDCNWAWRVSPDRDTKVIPWLDLCRDFGSVTSVDFQCSLNHDTVQQSATPEQPRRILTVFKISGDSGVYRQEPNSNKTTTTTIVANSRY